MWSDSACDAMRVCYRPHNTGVTIAPKYTKTNFVARRRRLVLTAAPATAQRIAIPGGLLSNVTSGRSHNQLRMERLRRQIRERIECNPPDFACQTSSATRVTRLGRRHAGGLAGRILWRVQKSEFWAVR